MLAYILNLSGWLLLPFMDGIAKYLSTEIHFVQVVWGRYFFMLLISVPLAFIFFRKELNLPKSISVQLWRSFFLFLSTIFFFYAISVISLAEALTLAFVSPIIVTILSIFYLNEKVGVHRWAAVIVGFFGVLVIIRPGFIDFNIASLSGLAAGISYAFYIIYTRKLSFTDSAIVTLIFTGSIGCLLITIAVPFFWTNLNLHQILFLFLLALIGTIGHFLIILSLRLGEASKLAPLGYFEITTNILVGYMFFDDLPDIWIYLGLSLIVFSGIYIFIRENRKI
tara:strand:- start:425 stop:1267 length:843 start_codon:yes stop_codon:yes gene_type:complete